MDKNNEQPTSAQVTVLGGGGVSTRSVELAPFGTKRRRRLLKLAVVAYQANQRQGTHKTKTRAETSYSEAKPWGQKHTGRARAGDKNSPLWRHGGTIFGPLPRDHRVGMTAKSRREALRSALLGKLLDGEVAVLEAFDAAKPSTKAAARSLKELGVTKTATIVVGDDSRNVWLSFRNIPRVDVVLATEVNALHVLKRKHLVFVGDAMSAVEKRLAPKACAG